MGVAFKLFPSEVRDDEGKIITRLTVRIPFHKAPESPQDVDYRYIPRDVFYYHLFEHFIELIMIGIMVSLILYPTERKYLLAYCSFFCLELVDMILYRLYYKGWFTDEVPWNVVKCLFFLVVLISLQCQRKQHK